MEGSRWKAEKERARVGEGSGRSQGVRKGGGQPGVSSAPPGVGDQSGEGLEPHGTDVKMEVSHTGLEIRLAHSPEPSNLNIGQVLRSTLTW